LHIKNIRLIFNGPVFTILYGIYIYILLTLISNLFNGVASDFILPITLTISLIYLIATIFEMLIPNPVTSILAFFSEIFKGTSVYLILFTIAIYIIRFILTFVQITIPEWVIATLLFGVVFLIAIYAVYNADKIRIKNIELEFSNLEKPLKFIHISDLHIGAIRKNRLLKNIVKEVNKICDDNKDKNSIDDENGKDNGNNEDNRNSNDNVNSKDNKNSEDNKNSDDSRNSKNNGNNNDDENNIDFLVITGDLADGSCPIYPNSFEHLAESKVPIYFAFGNHDFYPGIDNVLKATDVANIKVLYNEMVDIKGTQLIGIPFGSFGFDNRIIRKNAFNFDKSSDKYNNGFDFESIDEFKTSILLHHVPVSWDLFKELGVDLVLSGHTHGGQLFPFNFIVKKIFPYFRGLYNDDGKYLYVSEGIGTLTPPMRLGTSAEMVVFHLKSK